MNERGVKLPLSLQASGEDWWVNIVDRDGQVVGKWKDPELTGADDQEFLRRVNRPDENDQT